MGSNPHLSDLRPFIKAGKAVFPVEYEIPKRRFCRARKLRFGSIGRRYALFARPWRPCRAPG